MFKLSFLGGLASQRRALLLATEQAPIPLLPEVSAALDGLASPLSGPDTKTRNRFDVLIIGVKSIKGVLIRSAIWKSISSFIVLAGVLFSARIIQPNQSLNAALIFGALFFISKISDALIEYFDAMRRAQINRTLQANLMRLVNRKLIDLDPNALAPESSHLFTKGELKTLVSSDVEAIEDFISAAASQWIPAVITIVVLGPPMIWLSGIPGAIALLSAMAVTPVAAWGARMMEYFQLKAQREQDQLTGSVGEWVRNIRLVRYLGWESYFAKQLDELMRRFTMQFAGKHVVACIVYGISTSWWMVPILAMLTYAHLSGTPLSLIQLFSSVWILDHLMNYLQHISYSISMYGAAAASAERLQRLFNAPSLSARMIPSKENISSEKLGEPTHLILDHISVKLSNIPVLHDLSLEIDLHQRTAIVGEVGSGKSILLEILVGERAPTSGDINVRFQNGAVRPLWETSTYDAYRKVIAYAPQQPFLSNSLVRHNIDLSTELSLDAIQRAAASAQLDADIASFTRGLDEEVGETGINLSGGQKQRISIARAFVSKRPIFIMDDPLSAVDRTTEQALVDEILNHSEGLILVSHRLDELSRCNRILTLENGRVVEDGTPAALTADLNSHFSAFLNALENSERQST